MSRNLDRTDAVGRGVAWHVIANHVRPRVSVGGTPPAEA